MKENPHLEDCSFNVISFLDNRKLLKNSKDKQKIDNNKWSWNERYSEDWNHGTFETKEDAIDDALEWIKSHTGNPIIFVGQCEYIPLRTDVDPDRIMEELNETYCDDSGCDYYIYEGVTDEQRRWLEDKLSKVMCEFNQKIGLNPEWFKVINIEKINLKDYKKLKEGYFK